MAHQTFYVAINVTRLIANLLRVTKPPANFRNPWSVDRPDASRRRKFSERDSLMSIGAVDRRRAWEIDTAEIKHFRSQFVAPFRISLQRPTSGPNRGETRANLNKAGSVTE